MPLDRGIAGPPGFERRARAVQIQTRFPFSLMVGLAQLAQLDLRLGSRFVAAGEVDQWVSVALGLDLGM